MATSPASEPYAADGADARGVAAGVEADPPDPEQEHAERAEDERVAGDGVRLAVRVVLADARAEGDRAGEGDPAADGVHDGRSGEVVEAEPLEPAGGALAREAAPHPVAAYGVDDRRDEDRVTTAETRIE